MKLEDGSPSRPDGAPEPAHDKWPGDKNRWAGVERPYDRQDVDRLSGSVHIEHTLARLGAERLWELLQTREFVAALGSVDRQSGGATGASRPGCNLFKRLASRC